MRRRKNYGSLSWLGAESEIAPGIQLVLMAVVLLVVISIMSGGFYIFAVIKDLIFDPIQRGELSGLAFILLAVFAVFLMGKFGRKSREEYEVEGFKESLRQSRRKY